MVKNSNGGKGAKKTARKSVNETRDKERVKEGEEYGMVTEKLGGCECRVMKEGGEIVRCKIGGKFRGRNKRSNWIEKGTMIIMGERNFSEGQYDVIYVYDNEEKDELRSEGITIIREEDDGEGEVNIEFRKGTDVNVNYEEVRREVIEGIEREVSIEKEVSIEDL